MKGVETFSGHLAFIGYEHSPVVHAGDPETGETICGVQSWGTMIQYEVVPHEKRPCTNCTRILSFKYENDPFHNLWLDIAGHAE